MIAALRQRIAAAVQEAVVAVTGRDIEPPAVEDPPRPDLGDLAVPVALQLARQLGRSPRELAEELCGFLRDRPVEGVAGWEVAGPGFLNVYLHRGAVLDGLLGESGPEPVEELLGGLDERWLVEHTSINPNKAAHIGHLRNACMGDSLVRMLRWLGRRVEVHNYIDDTGVQVADVVLGLLDLRGLDAGAVRDVDDPFDYYCWDLYTEVTGAMETDESLQERRREVLLALEEGSGPEAEVGQVVVERIVSRHLDTMARLRIRYDLLVKEGDIVALDLWAEAFEVLKASERVYYSEEGKHRGCWMMSLKGAAGFEELSEADKVLVRSNGTATYVAKDIAYHFWKFGLLQRTFGYRPFRRDEDDRVTWESRSDGGEEGEFGDADRAVTVIDVRQSYLQAIVAEAFRIAGHEREAESLTHFAYEMVALTPATAVELGIPVGDAERERPHIEMSGRRGHGVKADDLLDALEERAAEEVRQRNPELDDEVCAELGRQIAVGAARYFLLRFSRNTVIAFDLAEALSFEGETGPYVQYAAVRAGSIFDKAEERWGVAAAEIVAALRGEASLQGFPALDAEDLEERLAGADPEGFWSLVLTLSRLEEVVAHAVDSLELSGLAKYAFVLAQQFNRFYHRYPVLQEEDPRERGLRLLVAHAFRARLQTALELLGIPLPERM